MRGGGGGREGGRQGTGWGVDAKAPSELWAPDQVFRTSQPRGLLFPFFFFLNCGTVYMTQFTSLAVLKCSNSVASSTFTTSCDHHHDLIPEHFHPSRRPTPLSPSPSLPAPRPPSIYGFGFASSGHFPQAESCNM